MKAAVLSKAQTSDCSAAAKRKGFNHVQKVKFFMSFRVRLILLLTSILLLTIVLVLALDKWAQKRAAQEVRQQSDQIKDAVNDGFSDFAFAMYVAIKNLNSDRYLYKQIRRESLSYRIRWNT